MKYSDQELQLFNDGMTLTADQLVLSRIKIINDNKDECKFSANLYATDDFIYLIPYDKTSIDIDPSIKIGGKVIKDICLGFQNYKDDDESYYHRYYDEVSISYFDGDTQKIKLKRYLEKVSLILASKILFIDIFRFIINSKDSNTINSEDSDTINPEDSNTINSEDSNYSLGE